MQFDNSVRRGGVSVKRIWLPLFYKTRREGGRHESNCVFVFLEKSIQEKGRREAFTQ